MPGKQRTARQHAIDLEDIAQLYLQCMPYRAIAKKLTAERPYTINHTTVCLDVKKILKQWREDRVADIHDAKQIELERLHNLEATHWDAWQTSVATDGVGERGHLEGVHKCIGSRCKILGVDAPQKHEITGADGAPFQPEQVKTMTQAELMAVIAKASAAPKADG